MNSLGQLPIIGASIATLGLTIGAAIPLVSNAQTSPQSTFPDVAPDYWAQPFIRGLAERNIITGYPDGTYRPKQALERDEFAAIIRKAFDQDREKQIESGSVYKDVPQGYWASQAIEDSVEQGFLSGDQNLFRPRQEVSKLEAINALTRGLDLNYQASVSPVTTIPPHMRRRAARRRRKPLMLPIGITSLMQPLLIQRANAARTPRVPTDSQATTTATAPVTPASIVQQAYKDADQIPENAVPQVAAATQSNIVVNYPNPNILNPTQAISRGETAALVYQTMAAQGKVPQIDSNNPAAKYIVRVGENK